MLIIAMRIAPSWWAPPAGHRWHPPATTAFDSAGHHFAVVGHPDEVDLWDIRALRDGVPKLGLA